MGFGVKACRRALRHAAAGAPGGDLLMVALDWLAAHGQAGEAWRMAEEVD